MNRVATLAPLAALCVMASATHAQAPTKTPPAQPSFALPSLDTPFTRRRGRLIQRRVIRILAPYSKTFYFVDRGVQRGLIYEIGEILERDLNKRLKTGNVEVHVAIRPMTQSEFIAALRWGRGDIAMGNLTVTPERAKFVDSSDPVMKNVAEIVVTGPGAPPIRAVEDLAGKEVDIRRSSSFYESIETLNAALARAGKPAVTIRPAQENLETEDILEMVNAGLVKVTIADDYMAAFWKQIFTKITPRPDVAVRSSAAIAWMIRKDSPRLKAELNRGLFTFAAYNAGPGRVDGLRRVAAQRGLDSNVRFNNVELVAAEKIGRETVTYVSNIYKYYLAYQMLAEERAQREEARQAARRVE